MLFQKPNAFDSDYFCEFLSSRFYTYVQQLWGVTDGTYNAFGFTERNKKDKGFIPEYYYSGNPNANPPVVSGYIGGKGTNNSGGMFFEDKLAALSFFGILDPEKRDASGSYKLRAEWLFFVDLAQITPGGIGKAGNTLQPQGQKLDKVCMNDVKNFVTNCGCGFVVVDMVEGADKVLERYSGVEKDNTIFKNISTKTENRFCFKLILELIYTPQTVTP